MTDHFFKYLQYQKRVSRHTLTAYRQDIDQFAAFLKQSFEHPDSDTATYAMVRSWMVSLVDTGLKATSVNRKIASLRAYYRFLQKENYIQENPMKKVKALRTEKRLPSFVREGEMVNLLDGTSFDDSFEGSRNRLILEMFYATGIRLSELLNLQESRINLSAVTIKVLGKRNKERIIPFPESIVPLVKNYLSIRNREIKLVDAGYLFVTEKGTICYPMMVYRIVKKYLGEHTTVEKKSPHVLRHSYATHLLNKGAEINAVKDLLGHSNLAATQVYTHNSMDKIKKLYDQAHPKA